MATFGGQKEAVKTLLSHGASVDLKTHVCIIFDFFE